MNEQSRKAMRRLADRLMGLFSRAGTPRERMHDAVTASLDERYEREGRYADKEGCREASAISNIRARAEQFDAVEEPLEYAALLLEATDHDRLFKYGLGPEVYDGRGIYGSIFSDIKSRVMPIIDTLGPDAATQVEARIEAIREANKRNQRHNYDAWMAWFEGMQKHCKAWREKPWKTLKAEAEGYDLEAQKMLLVCRSESREYQCMLDNNPRSLGTVELPEPLLWPEAAEYVTGRDMVMLSNDRIGKATALFLPEYGDIFLQTRCHVIEEENEWGYSIVSFEYVRCSEIPFEAVRHAFEACIGEKSRPFVPGEQEVAFVEDWRDFFQPHPKMPYDLDV